MDNTEEFRCISLCAGYAGIELGLRRAVPNLRTVAYVEVEAFACANLVAKIEAGLLDAAPVWTDIKTFDGKPFRGRVHIITAGYPCQPFSCAGKRKGTDDPRHLWPHIERIIKAVRPVWFFGENVAGHLAIGFPEVYRSLRNMGYKVEAGIFSAAECGAPHRRERLFILAHTGNLNGRERLGNQQGQDGKTEKSEPTDGGDTEFAPSRSGNRLVDADPNGFGQHPKPQESRRVGGAEAPAVPNGQLADTEGDGRQGGERNEGERRTRIVGAVEGGGVARWPSRPGRPQHEWERPRTVVVNAKGGGGGGVDGDDNGQAEKDGAGAQQPVGGGALLGDAESEQGRDERGNPENGRGGESGEQFGQAGGTELARDDGGRGGGEQRHGEGAEETGDNPQQAQPRLGRAAYGASCRVDRLRLLGNGVVPQQAERAFRTLMGKFDR